MRKFFIVLLVVISCVGIYSTHRVITKSQISKKIDTSLDDRGYSDFIEQKDVIFDSKTGTYYVQVFYITEKNHRYTYDVTSDKIFTIVYDKTNVSITDTEELNYVINE